MPAPRQIADQINGIIAYLVEKGLSDSQSSSYAFRRPIRGKLEEITFGNADHVSAALRDRAYEEIYRYLVQKRAYAVKMLDGALIQMMYTFSGETLERHRLAFFSAPHLEEFQNNPDVYLEDEIYADVLGRNIVPFPIRFDYDRRDEVHEGMEHPKSHLTLGQYKNCRIPVTAPVTPFWFFHFILRNFYHTAFTRYAEDLPPHGDSFAESILPNERNMVHVAIPAQVEQPASNLRR